MTHTLAPQVVIVNREGDAFEEVVIERSGVLIQRSWGGTSRERRISLALEDAIIVARAILALAGEPADTEYEVWVEREYARQCAAGSLFPAELSEL